VEGVDELEDGALVGRGQGLDLLRPLAEPGEPGRGLVGAGLEAEELVAGDPERAGEIDRTGRVAPAPPVLRIMPALYAPALDSRGLAVAV
jgi:hypothetical protein